MPEITGIDLLRRVKELGVDIPVIVITGHGDISLAVEAMKLGAVDFLEKPFDDDQLLAALKSALSRDADMAVHKAELAEINDKLAVLSNRERQVLDGLVAGSANKTIAFDLGISPRTVEIYRANLMTKMAANSLSDLVRMAMMAGILEEYRQARLSASHRRLSSALTPSPCMKRARICTGSRSVVPTPGLLSMRTAISLGPPLSAAANSRSKSSSSAAQAAIGDAGAARDGDEIGNRGARGRLAAGDLIEAVVPHHHGEILRRLHGDGGQAAELHQQRAVALERDHVALRLRDGDAQGDRDRQAHAARACRNSAAAGRSPTNRNWRCRCRR